MRDFRDGADVADGASSRVYYYHGHHHYSGSIFSFVSRMKQTRSCDDDVVC